MFIIVYQPLLTSYSQYQSSMWWVRAFASEWTATEFKAGGYGPSVSKRHFEAQGPKLTLKETFWDWNLGLSVPSWSLQVQINWTESSCCPSVPLDGEEVLFTDKVLFHLEKNFSLVQRPSINSNLFLWHEVVSVSLCPGEPWLTEVFLEVKYETSAEPSKFCLSQGLTSEGYLH